MISFFFLSFFFFLIQRDCYFNTVGCYSNNVVLYVCVYNVQQQQQQQSNAYFPNNTRTHIYLIFTIFQRPLNKYVNVHTIQHSHICHMYNTYTPLVLVHTTLHIHPYTCRRAHLYKTECEKIKWQSEIMPRTAFMVAYRLLYWQMYMIQIEEKKTPNRLLHLAVINGQIRAAHLFYD